jgi:mRNA deadenylase 3'-5' endonuclease subunit Ccr4
MSSLTYGALVIRWPMRSFLRDVLCAPCLQEVQSNHYTEFLQPELAKAGYTAIYKKKTMEIYTGNSYAIDGCATFFKTDRFALVKKYEVGAQQPPHSPSWC